MTFSSLLNDCSFLPEKSDDLLSSELDTNRSFPDIAALFAHNTGTVALASGTSADCARYNILGVNPWLSLRTTLTHAVVECGNRTISVETDPLQIVQFIIDRYRLSNGEYPLPFCGGLMGYLSYDLKDCIEELPRTSIDDLHLPHLYMVAPSIILVEDLLEKKKTISVSSVGGDALQRKECFLEIINTAVPEKNREPSVNQSSMSSSFEKEEYMRAIEEIHDYIVRGHVYQVNMSQRFETSFHGDSFDLFISLFKSNPAPFFAYINAGDHHIVSTSPERFIELRGKNVETRPIKGTRPRGKTPQDDLKNRNDLTTSCKDDAELSMIVDLLRNDIGKVCRAGSVKVREHKRVEGYKNVFHNVSIIDGILDYNKNAIDLIRATFPGGSITGCPKIRSMEIIDELEPVRRHIYTGSIGYIGFHDSMDLSIAIRTAIIKDSKLVFSVGGGIVYDSNPADEYLETLVKGESLINAICGTHIKDSSTLSYAWYNGKYKPSDEITISVGNEGFLYGYGIFETIRVTKGTPCRLQQHLNRFSKSWEYCFNTPYPDITWESIITYLIERNGLSFDVAVVKILAAAGTPDKPESMTLLVTAKRYVHRLNTAGRDGLFLATCPDKRHISLASHKTMNYMFCKVANNRAKQQGADEALIINTDGSVCESATANILCIIGGSWYRPKSDYVLPGTMESAVCELLASRGIKVQTCLLSVDELKEADQVFLTNALMGIVPVLRIDSVTLNNPGTELCREINSVLLDC
ncbi:MAG: aminodeoxychorismate synthase component I [Chitinispirillaceae bacterium]|nr:aminodeoxychorismate synthase component I [Chitinispirillaceae bacterium]